MIWKSMSNDLHLIVHSSHFFSSLSIFLIIFFMTLDCEVFQTNYYKRMNQKHNPFRTLYMSIIIHQSLFG